MNITGASQFVDASGVYDIEPGSFSRPSLAGPDGVLERWLLFTDTAGRGHAVGPGGLHLIDPVVGAGTVQYRDPVADLNAMQQPSSPFGNQERLRVPGG